MTDAENWYHSPEYQRILHLRVKNFAPARLAQQIRAARMAAGGRGLIEHIGTDTKV